MNAVQLITWEIKLKNRYYIFTLSIVFGIIAIFILDTIISNEMIKNRFLDRDHWGDYYGFTFQNIMWVVFFVGLGEIFFIYQGVNERNLGFNKRYLPEDDITILESLDMKNISKEINKDAKIDGSLANFIKKLIIQFQISHSSEQVGTMLNYQLDMRSAMIDSEFNMVRYISWFIPTLGFIGTVIGIAQALAYAGEVNGVGDRFVAELTSKLALAFDTTFVALLMSAVLVFLTHLIQGKDEKNLVKIGQYCLDNFINRLYTQKS